MRYLITILTVSAFALMLGFAQSAYAHSGPFGPFDDVELPKSSDFIDPGGHTNVEFTWDLYRTDESILTQTVVCVYIDDTSMDVNNPAEIDSDDYPPADPDQTYLVPTQRSDFFEDPPEIEGSDLKIHMVRCYGSGDHWDQMTFSYELTDGE